MHVCVCVVCVCVRVRVLWSFLFGNRSDHFPERTEMRKNDPLRQSMAFKSMVRARRISEAFSIADIHQARGDRWSAAGLTPQFSCSDETITAEKYCEKLVEMHQKFT